MPFASKLPRVHPGTSGVTVLEHMERVDAVEAGLRRLAVEECVIVEEEEELIAAGAVAGAEEAPEEVDVGVSASPAQRPSTILEATDEDAGAGGEGSLTPGRHSPLLSPISDTAVQSGLDSLTSSMTEEDLVAMSRSASALDPNATPMHMRFGSQDPSAGPSALGQTLDWIREETAEQRKRIMISEVWCIYASQYQIGSDVMLQRIEIVQTKALLSCW